MNINTAYEFVKDLANKEQKGFIPSAKFNRFAERAQMEVFMKRYGNPQEYQPGRPVPRIAFQMTQKISDDLRPFLKKINLGINKYGQAILPNDFIHPSSLRYVVTKEGSHEDVPVKVVNDDKLGYRLSSKIVPPTKEYPVCCFYDQYIQFKPDNMVSVVFTYLRKPKTPVWAFTIVNSREVYNPTGSVDFEFPDDVHNEICIKILGYVGIQIREAELLQYAEMKTQQGI